jgi:hypothetical protein
MSQTIRFQHREAPDDVYSMSVSDEEFTVIVIRRVEAMGYTIVDVSPPNARWVPQRSEIQAAARR